MFSDEDVVIPELIGELDLLQRFVIYLDRLGIFIFRLPGSPRDFEVREVGEGASVKADEELD